jgi:hypothetical protein
LPENVTQSTEAWITNRFYCDEHHHCKTTKAPPQQRPDEIWAFQITLATRNAHYRLDTAEISDPRLQRDARSARLRFLIRAAFRVASSRLPKRYLHHSHIISADFHGHLRVPAVLPISALDRSFNFVYDDLDMGGNLGEYVDQFVGNNRIDEGRVVLAVFGARSNQV